VLSPREIHRLRRVRAMLDAWYTPPPTRPMTAAELRTLIRAEVEACLARLSAALAARDASEREVRL
jgi:hypothetical protein